MGSVQNTYRVLFVWMLIALTSLFPSKVVGQTVAWELSPSDYSAITRFGKNLYQVEQGGKWGLIRADGTIVVPVEADDISKFYDHLALVTVNEAEGRNRIMGVLADDGTYTPFAKVYYTLSGQEFFSEGLISVQNAKGKKGYVNKTGDAVCGFDKTYYRIKPFTEGYAAVSVKRGYFYLIDKHGEKKQMQLPDDQVGGSIGYVYNAWQGKTLLIDTYNNFYKYDLNTGDCVKLGKELKEYDATDFLFRPVTLTGCSDTAPFVPLPDGEKGLSPTKQGGKYGFEDNGKLVLPCQLTSATPFEDGLSIVELNGKKGILRYYGGQADFSVNAQQSQIEFDAGSTVSCKFALQVPSVWSGKQVEVTLTERGVGDGFAPAWDGNQYAVQLSPVKSVQKDYTVVVSAEGLQLWSGNLAYTLKKKVVGLTIGSLALDGDITDIDGKLNGSFVIYNPNEEEVVTSIGFTHSSMIAEVGGYPQTLKLGAGERKTVSFYLATVKKQGKWEHTISVSSSKGGSASLTAEIETF